jgi:hypothetical protein
MPTCNHFPTHAIVTRPAVKPLSCLDNQPVPKVFQMRVLILPLAATIGFSNPLAAQAPAPNQAVAAYSYADLADLAVAAPVVAEVALTRIVPLKKGEAGPPPPGHARYYLEGQLLRLIRGADGLPGSVGWLADLPLDSANRAPKLKKKARFILMARRVPGRPQELVLAGPRAQIAWTAEVDAQVRSIVTALAAPDAPPRITGVGNAFHVTGSLPGESETQIFLTTADNRPVSLNVLRRPGETPRWAVALSDMIDDSAEPPPRDTLLWYSLACTLPPVLPLRSVASLDAAAAAAARADYALVLRGLGACGRG